jgi:ABC-type bacteriocin/lantibiotic exporter with double-glycine peptidase domain
MITSFVALLVATVFFNIGVSDKQYLNKENAFLQKGKNDCGVAAAKNVLMAFNKNPDAIDTLLNPSDNGLTLLDIKAALNKQGLHCTGYKTTLNDLTKLGLPAIAHINDNHFVVVESIEAESVLLIDPSVGRLRYRASAFEEKWNGIALCVSDKQESLPRQKF